MAASRKLQGEIDRCLKKVCEGVEQFEDIWKKVHNATNSNQKEKYEADLKKEIKKLQRLRDQIKSWLASGEIKDKSQLLDNRKLIETQMERFKVVERETKTKAYSKEGLGAAQNKDPAQREKDETNRWLSESIDTLNIQVDQFESEIESLLAAGKKKKVDKDKLDRVEGLRDTLERHRFHIKKLEILMRMLNNESVDCDQIKKLKEDVEYYIESSQDPDFVDNDCIYDDIDMEELEYQPPELNHVSGSHDSTDGSTPSSSVCGSSPAPSPAATASASTIINHSTTLISSTDHSSSSSTTTVELPTTTSNATTTHHDSSRKRPGNKEESISGTTPVKPQVVRPSIAPTLNSLSNHSTICNKATPPPSTPTKPVSGNTSQSTPNNSSSSSGSVNHLISPSQMNNRDSTHGTSSNSILHNSINTHTMNSLTTSSISNNIIAHSNSNGQSSSLSSLGAPVTTTNSQGAGSGNLTEPGVSLKTMAQKKLNEVTLARDKVNNLSSSIGGSVTCSSIKSITKNTDGTNSSSNIRGGSGGDKPQSKQSGGSNNPNATAPATSTTSSSNNPSSSATSEAHVPPLLGVAPLGPVHLTPDNKIQYERLQSTYYHMPHPSDSERFRLHFPRQPCQTPSYYPQVFKVPPPLSDTVDFFQRLSTETLFFIFYYMEGTKAQYLAAKALKKQSWRFHTKYMMWFQRHEEPKAITDEYEQGTYIFFDFENWGQRKKENFVFEYRFLEDRDLN